MTARIYAICNQKGGVGKTTSAFNLARAAVVRGSRVLAVDNDPQGNLTLVAAAEQVPADQEGLADALSKRAPATIRDVIVPGIWPGLDVVPTVGASLGSVRDELVVAGAGREGRLRDALSTVAEDYDVILIDCAPSLDQLTINGLTAAERVFIVTEAKLWATDGLAQLLETIDLVRTYYNPTLEIGGVLVNRYEAQTTGGQNWLDQLKQAGQDRGIPILEPIPKHAFIADAAESARGLDEWGTRRAATIADLYTHHLAVLEGQPA